MHLTKRNRVYHFRFKVPTSIQDQVGLTEIRCSLRTGDLPAASSASRHLSPKVLSLFKRLIDGSRMDKDQVKIIIDEYIAEGLKRIWDYQRTGPKLSRGQLEDRLTAIEFQREEYL